MTEIEIQRGRHAQQEAHHAILLCLLTELCKGSENTFLAQFSEKISLARLRYKTDEFHDVCTQLDEFMEGLFVCLDAISALQTEETGKD